MQRSFLSFRKGQERGVYTRRGRTIDASKIYELKQSGYGATET